MANYLTHHTKKKRILAKKEQELRRLLESDASAEKLNSAAIAVRDARIRVLRVQRSLIPPKDDGRLRYAVIDTKIREISEASAESILQKFQ